LIVLEEEETTVSGIVLPDTPRRSRSAAASRPSAPAPVTGREHIPMDSKRATIIFSKYGGTEIKLGATRF
jgi:co-chaperonin GroES (HSP10)